MIFGKRRARKRSSRSRILRKPRTEKLESRRLLAAELFPGNSTETVYWRDGFTEVIQHEWIVHLESDIPVVETGLRYSERNETRVVSPIAKTEQRRYHTLPLRKLSDSGSSTVYLYRFSDGMLRDATLDALLRTPEFRWAEPNFVVATNAIPDDPSFGSQWGLHQDSIPDVDIDAPEAWDLTTGSSSVVVGVIDTGVDYTHEDLAQNIWVNTVECPAGVSNCISDGIDDDGNGYVDDFYGWDFANNDNDPLDDHSHGTHVAGTIAAAGSNATGVVGVSWNTRIMPLKFIRSNGTGSTADAIEAIQYATMMNRDYGVNIRVTNNSWGSTSYSQALYDAIEESRQQDILFVAAAGNSAIDNDTTPHYPSSYPHDNVIAVASTTADGSLSSFSNRGLTSVDLGAPGSQIYSTTPGNQYGNKSGTSMASPHVAGVAALAWAVDANLLYSQVRDAIYSGVEPLDSLTGKTVTGGLVNAANTLEQLGLFATAISPAEDEFLSSQPTVFTIDFSHPLDTTSVDASDLTVGGTPATSFTIVDTDTVEFAFATSPVANEGPYVMEISVESILRSSDSDGIASFSSRFFYDPTPLQVVSVSPGDSSVLTLPSPSLRFDFSDDIASGSIGLADLTLSSGRIDRYTIIDSDTVEYELTGFDGERPLQVSLPSGAVTDPFGFPNEAFSATFGLDYVAVPYPASFQPAYPRGSQLYTSMLPGYWHDASDGDSFTIQLETNQTLSVLLTPDPQDASGTLAGRLRVLDPNGTVVFDQTGGAGSGGSSGEVIAMLSHSVTSVGLWTVQVDSVGTTGGNYSLQIALGGSYESDLVTQGTNDSQATAQDLSSGWIQLDSSSTRNGVHGAVSSQTDHDWFEIPLPANSETSFVIQSGDDGSWPLSLTLHATDGTLLATGSELASAVRIDRSIIDQAGPVYLNVSSGTGGSNPWNGPVTYTVAVTTGATLDDDGKGIDANGSVSVAQSLGKSLRSAGYVGQHLDSSINQVDAGEEELGEMTTVAPGHFLPAEWLESATIHSEGQVTTVRLDHPRDPRVLANSLRKNEHFVSINSDSEGDFVRDAVYTPDGTRILMVHRESRNVLVYNVASGAIEADIPVAGQPVDLEVTPDGAYAITANTSGNTVSIIDLATLSNVKDIALSASWPYRVHVTSDGTHAVVATADEEFVVISLASQSELHAFVSPGLGSTLIFFSTGKAGRLGFQYADFVLTPDSTKLISPASNGTNRSVRIYDIATGNQLSNIPLSGSRPTVTLTSDGSTAYAVTTGENTSAITKIDVATGTVLQTLPTETLFGDQSLLTPDEQYIIAPALNSTLFIDVADGSTSANLHTQAEVIMSFSHDGTYLVGRHVIDVASQTVVTSLPTFGFMNMAEMSPTELQGLQLGWSLDDTYRSVDLTTISTAGQATVGPFLSPGSSPEGDTPDSIAITPDGLRAVTANYDSKNLSIIDLQTETVLAWVDIGSQVDRVVITPDGTTAVVTSSEDDTLTLVDLNTYTVITTLLGLAPGPRDLLLSPDGSTAYVVTTGANDSTDKLHFVDLNGTATVISGTLNIGNAANGNYRFTRLTLSPDGAILVVPVSRDDEVVLIDTATRQEISRLHTNSFPEKAVFSPDGQRLYVLTSGNESVTVIDIDGANATVVGQVHGITNPYGLAIDNTGRYLYTASFYDRLVRVIDAETLSLVASVPIESDARVIELMLVGQVLYLLGGEGTPLVIPLNDDNGHLMRVLAKGSDSRFIDDVLLSGRSRTFAYSDPLKTVAAVSFNNDGIDLVEYSSDSSGDEDFYRFLPQVGDAVTIEVTMPGTAPGLFDNILDVGFDLRSPSGDLLAHSDGPLVNFTATSIGEHTIRVYAQELTLGEYLIAVSGVTVPGGPSLLKLSPVDDETDVSDGAVLQMTFDKPVVPATGTVAIHRVIDDSVLESISITSPQVTINGPSVAVSPSVSWELNTEYYVLVDAGTVEDSQGNVFAGLATPGLWNFTIGFGHDFGDAPTPYPVVNGDGGARHAVIGPQLGTNRDSELEGLPSAGADGDDLSENDDEDGISYDVLRVGNAGAAITVNVQSTSEAKLDAWIDFNHDGVWNTGTERIAASMPVVNGDNTLLFSVPSWATQGETFARFRVSTIGGLGVGGNSLDGEVEDHRITISPPALASEYFGQIDLLATAGIGYTSLAVVDLDGDGDSDLVSTRGTNNRLAWFENDGSGTFAEHDVDNSSKIQTSLVAIDIDGDGDKDIVGVNRWADEVSWFENTGNQGFDTHLIDKTDFNSSLSDIDLWDYDNDGDIDLLVVDQLGDDVYVYENDGNQSFLRSLLIDATNITHAEVADLDRDGSLEIVTFGFNGISWYENSVSGWSENIVSSSNTNAGDLIDLDGDGDMDIVAGTYGGILWHENDAGVFQPSLELVERPGAVAGALEGTDLDGDGDTDLISRGLLPGSDIRWYQNDGELNFSPVDLPIKHPSISFVAPIDDDGDGDLDLAIVSYSAGLGIIENINGIPPQVLSLTPNPDLAVVDSQTDLTMVFDQPVLAIGGTVGIWDVTADTLLESFSLTSSSVSVVDNVVTISVAATLDPITQYEVRIPYGALEGLQGDKYFGLTSGQWRFETADVGIDYGDAPDVISGSSQSPLDYRVTLADGGPSHVVTPGLFLGILVDADDGLTQNIHANADDGIGTRNDEDGLTDPIKDLLLTTGSQPKIRILVTNLTASDATLSGWIDYDGDGLFEDGESASVDVPNGTVKSQFTLVMPVVPEDIVPSTYARFRLGSDSGATAPDGPSGAGEVEDYVATILRPGLNSATTLTTIGDAFGGGPSIADDVQFGKSVAMIGDVDFDGVIDIAVGAPLSSVAGDDSGTVYILLMNADGTVKSSQEINGSLPEIPADKQDMFGVALANVGDLDFDGVPDLAVLSQRTLNTGASIHLLYLNSDGSLKTHEKFSVNTVSTDRRPNALAYLGDLNMDGYSDYAIGFHEALIDGLTRGAVSIQFGNADSSESLSQRITQQQGGGPSLSLGANFGYSLTSLGDLDGDGVTDIAVGAPTDDRGGNNTGTVYLLMMNHDGTVKSSTAIDGTGTNQPPNPQNAYFGSALTAISDRNGDGVMDLAVGVEQHGASSLKTGRIDLLLLNSDGSVQSHATLTEGVGPITGLVDGDRFGGSIAAIGDLNDDGQMDLLVGAWGDDGNGADRGAVHLLTLDEATLQLTIVPAGVDENVGTINATIARDPDADLSQPLVVTLSSSNDGDATVPATVTILANQTQSDSFSISIVDNSVYDGTRTVTIGATATGFVGSSDSFDIQDDDPPPPPTVQDVIINDDQAGRSHITKLQITFSETVNHSDLQNAFSIKNIDTNVDVQSIVVSSSDANGKTTAVLSFSSGASIVSRQGTGALAHSLDDGNYELIIDPNFVISAGNNAKLISQYTFGGQLKAAPNNDDFFRLYGDHDGDGDTDLTDMNDGFLASFGSTSGDGNFHADFDGDGDGDVDLLDLNNHFIPHFGATRQ